MGYLLLILLVIGLAVTYWQIAIAVGTVAVFLTWRRRANRPKPIRAVILDMPAGRAKLNVVGEGSYQGTLEIIAGGRTIDGGANRHHTAVLLAEPTNRYDPNAVEVRIDSQRVGYPSREDALAYRAAIDIAAASGLVIAAPATLQGGWDRGPDDRGSFGVLLNMNGPGEVEAEVTQAIIRGSA